MKSKSDLMHVEKVYNKRGELSFRLYCSGKDTRPNRKSDYRLYVTTCHVPPECRTKKDIETFRYQCQLDWKKEVDRRSQGLSYQESDKIKFCDYAEQWVENIMIYNNEGYNYYSRCKSNLKIFKEKFGRYTLQEMTLPVIQNFCNWLCTRTYKKETITVKKSIKEVMKEKQLRFKDICTGCGISNSTLCNILTIGKHVNQDTATKLCNFLSIKFETYFDADIQELHYSKNANKCVKVMLHTILARAVKEGLISRNYASKEYIDPLKGENKTKLIFETNEEIKEFVSLVNKETDIRKQVAFLIPLNIGCRGAELTGLSWDSIDFEKNTITINKNTLYVPSFGIVTKKTKNKSSNRTVTISNNLANLLKKYKVWWDNQKEIFGDAWGVNNKLFVQDDGKDMCNATINKWLTKFEKEHNLKHVTLHGLRHTNITMQITNGVDIKTVSKRVGHGDIRTTLNIYAHYTKEADEKASALIDNLLYD